MNNEQELLIELKKIIYYFLSEYPKNMYESQGRSPLSYYPIKRRSTRLQNKVDYKKFF